MTMNQRDFAKTLRQNMTDAERLLWKHLRAHRYSGQKFRRQQPIGPYIVDFVHFGSRLIVECDGGQHNENPVDKRRDAWLQAQGFHVLRFWNHDILHQTESVLSTLFDILSPLSPNPSPTRGEGDSGGSTHRTQTNATTPLSPRGRGAGGEGGQRLQTDAEAAEDNKAQPVSGQHRTTKRNHE
jgi:very-short-patch-repair endonuclease